MCGIAAYLHLNSVTSVSIVVAQRYAVAYVPNTVKMTNKLYMLVTCAGDADSESANEVQDPDEGSGAALTKVVMARRTRLSCSGSLHPLWLLEALQVGKNKGDLTILEKTQQTRFGSQYYV